MVTGPRKFSTATPVFSTSRFIDMTTGTSSLAVGHRLRWVTCQSLTCDSQTAYLHGLISKLIFAFRSDLERVRASMWMWRGQEDWTHPWEMLSTSLHSGNQLLLFLNTTTQAHTIRLELSCHYILYGVTQFAVIPHKGWNCIHQSHLLIVWCVFFF